MSTVNSSQGQSTRAPSRKRAGNTCTDTCCVKRAKLVVHGAQLPQLTQQEVADIVDFVMASLWASH